MTSCLQLESTTLASKMKILLPIDTSLIYSRSEATENFMSSSVPESWWWQGLAEVFTSATWARLHGTAGDQHLRDTPSKLTSFPGFRVMYLTDIRSAQFSSEKVHPQHPKTPTHSFSSFEAETALTAEVMTEKSHSGLQLSINQLTRSFTWSRQHH